jgi:hypothetical protein
MAVKSRSLGWFIPPLFLYIVFIYYCCTCFLPEFNCLLDVNIINQSIYDYPFIYLQKKIIKFTDLS